MHPLHFVGFESWWSKLKEYSTQKRNFTKWEDFANPTDFKMILSDFLFSPYGFNFKACFKFDGELECNKPAPRIKVRILLILGEVCSSILVEMLIKHLPKICVELFQRKYLVSTKV